LRCWYSWQLADGTNFSVNLFWTGVASASEVGAGFIVSGTPYMPKFFRDVRKRTQSLSTTAGKTLDRAFGTRTFGTSRAVSRDYTNDFVYRGPHPSLAGRGTVNSHYQDESEQSLEKFDRRVSDEESAVIFPSPTTELKVLPEVPTPAPAWLSGSNSNRNSHRSESTSGTEIPHRPSDHIIRTTDIRIDFDIPQRTSSRKRERDFDLKSKYHPER
jgi:hypothetical protein